MNSRRKLASRLAALGLLPALPLLVWLTAVQPFVDVKQDFQSRISEDRDLLERYRLAAAKRDALNERRDALTARAAEGLGFLKGESVEIAAAALQNDTKSIIRSQKGTLRSSQVLNPQAEGPYTKVGIRLALSVEIEGLQRILHRLEGGERVLFIDNLDVRAAAKPRGSGTKQPRRLLDVRFDLFGYLQGKTK